MRRQLNRLGRIGLAVVLCMLGLVVSPRPALAQSGVIVTEVAFNASPDWVELYNAGGSSVDISGYRLTDLDGKDTAFAASAVTLAPGDYAIIHWASGTDETDATGDTNGNGHIDLYVGDTTLTSTDDQAVLQDESETVIDAVVWSNRDGGGYKSEWDDFNDLAPDQWDYSDVSTWSEYEARSWTDSDGVGSGDSLARYLDPGTAVYADSNKATDWYYEANPTPGTQSDETVVELASFSATAYSDRVHLAWSTDSEIDNAGFNVWRARAADGPYTKLNPTLIPARGGPTWGAVYAYDDVNVVAGATYYYKLEDVDIFGASTFYGPLTAAVAQVSQRGVHLYLPLVVRAR